MIHLHKLQESKSELTSQEIPDYKLCIAKGCTISVHWSKAKTCGCPVPNSCSNCPMPDFTKKNCCFFSPWSFSSNTDYNVPYTGENSIVTNCPKIILPQLFRQEFGFIQLDTIVFDPSTCTEVFKPAYFPIIIHPNSFHSGEFDDYFTSYQPLEELKLDHVDIQSTIFGDSSSDVPIIYSKRKKRTSSKNSSKKPTPLNEKQEIEFNSPVHSPVQSPVPSSAPSPVSFPALTMESSQISDTPVVVRSPVEFAIPQALPKKENPNIVHISLDQYRKAMENYPNHLERKMNAMRACQTYVVGEMEKMTLESSNDFLKQCELSPVLHDNAYDYVSSSGFIHPFIYKKYYVYMLKSKTKHNPSHSAICKTDPNTACYQYATQYPGSVRLHFEIFEMFPYISHDPKLGTQILNQLKEIYYTPKLQQSIFYFHLAHLDSRMPRFLKEAKIEEIHENNLSELFEQAKDENQCYITASNYDFFYQYFSLYIKSLNFSNKNGLLMSKTIFREILTKSIDFVQMKAPPLKSEDFIPYYPNNLDWKKTPKLYEKKFISFYLCNQIPADKSKIQLPFIPHYHHGNGKHIHLEFALAFCMKKPIFRVTLYESDGTLSSNAEVKWEKFVESKQMFFKIVAELIGIPYSELLMSDSQVGNISRSARSFKGPIPDPKPNEPVPISIGSFVFIFEQEDQSTENQRFVTVPLEFFFLIWYKIIKPMRKRGKPTRSTRAKTPLSKSLLTNDDDDSSSDEEDDVISTVLSTSQSQTSSPPPSYVASPISTPIHLSSQPMDQ